MRCLLSFSRRYTRNQNGAAAAEFALLVMLLAIPILNVVDFTLYSWDKMQVDNAAQIGAQAARANCGYTMQPATTNCPTLNSVVQTGVQSSTLGTNVSSSIVEHYYCMVGGTLKSVWTPPVSNANPIPTDCSQNGIGGSAADRPGDYVQITANYTYTPVFSAVSVVALLPTPIARTAWMRL